LTNRINAKLRELLSILFDLRGDGFQLTEDVHEVNQTQTKLISFELNFVEMVELMEQSQRHGISNGSNSRYSSLKQSLSDTYGDLRPFLLAYLRLDIEDERVGLRTLGHGTDAFEAIWAYESLQEFVDSDDVFFRDRVARALDAIKDYTEHLHCLFETRV
jgi:hypothetical protein